jgi:hypothetical protein
MGTVRGLGTQSPGDLRFFAFPGPGVPKIELERLNCRQINGLGGVPAFPLSYRERGAVWEPPLSVGIESAETMGGADDVHAPPQGAYDRLDDADQRHDHGPVVVEDHMGRPGPFPGPFPMRGPPRATSLATEKIDDPREKPQLWSISGLAVELRQGRRTIVVRVRTLKRAGTVREHPVITLRTWSAPALPGRTGTHPCGC